MNGTLVPYTLNKGNPVEQHTVGQANGEARFSLGQIVATPNALVSITNDEILVALSRHVRGDWGTLHKEDWNANEQALHNGGRLLSAFHSSQNVKFWIITEADRTVTTVLLPEDY